MIAFLELMPGIGPEPAFIKEGAAVVPNPNAGQPAILDEFGAAGLKIDPSASPVAPEGPPAARIVPGTRVIETNSQAIESALLSSGFLSRKAGGGDTLRRDMIPLGDSITAGGQNGNADKPSENIFGDNAYNYASVLSMGRLRLLRNAGIAGNTTQQVLQRLQRDVFTPFAEAGVTSGLVPYMAGTNDNEANLGKTEAECAVVTRENDKAVIEAILACGHTPVMCTIAPNNFAGFRKRIAIVNANKRDLARQFGIPLVDMYDVLANTSTGEYRAGVFFESTHPNAYGYRDMGQRLVDELLPFLPPGQPQIVAFNPDSSTLFNGTLNPLLLTAAAPPTPDGWTLEGGEGYTASLAPNPVLGPGNIATSIGAAGAKGNHALSTTIAKAGNFSVGDLVFFGVGFRFFGGDLGEGGSGCILQLAATGSTGAPYIARLHLTADVPRGMFCSSAVVPAGTTALTASMILNGQGQVDRWQPTIRNLTTSGVTA